MWTQKIFKNSYKFQNPLHQNYKHQKVLEVLLSDIIATEYLHSVIVFMPDCEFKTVMPANVFIGKAWTEYVKGFKDEVIPVMKLKRIQLRIEKEINMVGRYKQWLGMMSKHYPEAKMLWNEVKRIKQLSEIIHLFQRASTK